ncbi:hypothetical protein EZS27_039230, partial [termite gut metagenome]
MNKCFYLLLTYMCLVGSAYATPVPRIRGKIVEAGSNRPINYADIFLLSGKNETLVYQSLPENDGSFTIMDVRDGNYTLYIRLVGFDVYTRPNIVLNVSTSVLDLGTIEMKALETELAEVEVVARKKQIIYRLDKKVIEA